jgi:S-adenosylmethionine:tRNA ribosyltransferase-isomerase
MKIDELDYDLPPELIAQKPSEVRGGSRLLVLDRESGEFADRMFTDIEDMINPGDCLVVNDTKVLAARFFGSRQSGAALEGLFLGCDESGRWKVMLRNSRKVKEGERVILFDNIEKREAFTAIAAERGEDGTFFIQVESELDVEKVLDVIGYAPLPPYIKRPRGGDRPEYDKERYQTVFAAQSGAVAAPTAGLHFTDEMLERLKAKGVRYAKVTLHVGAGTFKPVTAKNVEDHDIHSERYSIDAANAAIINAAKAAGGRVIAVGTTSVRTLETVAREGQITEAAGDTRLFITPGFEYRAVDAMITNFHLPKSTLLALVGAFAGMENIMAAYRHAVEQKYRFFSYGDAMFIR